MMARGNTGIHGLLVPPEIARTAETTGISKVQTGSGRIIVLSILAGAFIAFGAVFSTLVTSGSTLPFGITRLLGGLAFSLGLILVVLAGAELFTGNSLMVMAWANKRISGKSLILNWLLVYVGNMTGAFAIAVMILLSGHYLMGQGITGEHMLNIALAKCELHFGQALILGILCNILVCLAIWLCYSTRSLPGKVLAIVFPITAFVAAGFEHSVANMYFIPAGILVKEWGNPELWGLLHTSASHYGPVSWGNYFFSNLLPVTLGNIIGGSLFIGLAYWFIYLRSIEQGSKQIA